jgi:hypothetical protein
MKLALLCHQHPEQPPYHVLRRVEELDPMDYRSRCFVQFVESTHRPITCPRCGSIHQHDHDAVPA